MGKFLLGSRVAWQIFTDSVDQKDYGGSFEFFLIISIKVAGILAFLSRECVNVFAIVVDDACNFSVELLKYGLVFRVPISKIRCLFRHGCHLVLNTKCRVCLGMKKTERVNNTIRCQLDRPEHGVLWAPDRCSQSPRSYIFQVSACCATLCLVLSEHQVQVYRDRENSSTCCDVLQHADGLRVAQLGS